MQGTKTRLLIATTNIGKVREFQVLLASSHLDLVCPPDLGMSLQVDETGQTFIENARIKARAHFAAARIPTLAEDSGIEIDALGGEPGVRSARYKGLPDGPVKNALILERLLDVAASRRGCRYRCAIVLIDEQGAEHSFEGMCTGRVAFTPAGTGGFGFDPIFFLPRLGHTMAEISEEGKNRISHRGRAARKLLAYLRRVRSSPSGPAD